MSRGARQSHSDTDRTTERHTYFEGLRHQYIHETRAEAAREVKRIRCEKLSIAFLGVCNIFPPLPILFATENLDAAISIEPLGSKNVFMASWVQVVGRSPSPTSTKQLRSAFTVL